MELHACRLESSSGNVLTPTGSTGNSRVLPQVVAYVSLKSGAFRQVKPWRVDTPGDVMIHPDPGVELRGVRRRGMKCAGRTCAGHVRGTRARDDVRGTTDRVAEPQVVLEPLSGAGALQLSRAARRPSRAEPQATHQSRCRTASHPPITVPNRKLPTNHGTEPLVTCGSAIPATSNLRFGGQNHGGARTTCGSATWVTSNLRFGGRDRRRHTNNLRFDHPGHRGHPSHPSHPAHQQPAARHQERQHRPSPSPSVRSRPTALPAPVALTS